MRSSTLIVGLLLFIMGDAHAYLDPGAGSMILQGIIAGIAGGFMVLRSYWGKVKQLFTRRKAIDLGAEPRDCGP
ncbi:MAG: hypothetical protein ACREXW_03465 [Gammaproteobacteria bacterium]